MNVNFNKLFAQLFNCLIRRSVGVPRLRKVGLGKFRNQPCPCGSGKKFKKCCITRGTGYA